jgi:TolB-like protein/tetratricopeptide (TPR) repeat protein
MSLFSELKRRNVFRVAVLYLAVSWLVLQATDVLSSLLELPPGIGKIVILLLVLGFPASIAFSWLYELTPDGIKRDASVDVDSSSRLHTARRMNILTIVAAVLALLVVTADRLVPEKVGLASSGSAPVAVAVLPFIDLSSEGDQEHFGDGIAEEVLNLLANVRGLRVTSRTSSFSFKGNSSDLRSIADNLGVSHIVEGSVRKFGTRVRVTAQLIDVGQDEHIWSETYDRELTDVFDIQSDVAGQIARVLSTALSSDEVSLIGQRPTSNLAAWQNFVAARIIYRDRRSADDIDRAMSLVDAAIEQDPDFSRAYSLKAALLLGPVFFESADRNLESRMKIATATAEHALELSPQLGEPYFVLAQVAYWEGRLDDSEKFFREAVSRAPNNADGRNWYGQFLIVAGYLQRGWAEVQRSAELDPLSPIISWQVAFAAMTVGRLDVVKAFASKSRENGWPSWQPNAIEGGATLQARKFDEAEALYLAAMPHRKEQITLAFDAMRNGHIDAATRQNLDGLSAYGPPGASRWNTEILAGDLDAAYRTAWADWEQHSRTDGSDGAPEQGAGRTDERLRADWWFPASSAFRADARFATLMEAVGLLEFWQSNGSPDLCTLVGETLTCR